MNDRTHWLKVMVVAVGCLGIMASATAVAPQGNSNAEQLVWPKEWVAFGPVEPDEPVDIAKMASLVSADRLATIPDQLMVKGHRFRAKRVSFVDNQIDLAHLFGGTQRGKAVYLFARLTAGKDLEVKIGGGADWWMQWWLDGKPVYDTLRTGNRAFPIAISNHVFDLSLAKGEHILAVCAISGSNSFVLAAGGPQDLQDLQDLESEYKKAYDAGHKKMYGYRHWSDPINFAAARAEFEKALRLARTKSEKAAAHVAITQSRLLDPSKTDYSAIRKEYAKVLAMKPTPDGRGSTYPRMDAQLGIGETYLLEKNYSVARREFAKAREISSDPLWSGDIQFGIARSYLQERKYDAARREFARLLEMKDFRNEDVIKAVAQTLIDAMSLIPRLRPDHPRLFFNSDTWPAVKARALGVEKQYFNEMKASIDQIAPELIRTGDWGLQVMSAAFVYRVTGEEALLDKVKKMLRATVDHYLLRQAYNAHVYSRIGCVAALDWVWNDLRPPEREQLAADMLSYVYTKCVEDRIRGLNMLQRDPYYYERNVLWYAGLLLLDDALDDVDYARVLSVLGQGYSHNKQHFKEYILGRLGDDGAFDLKLGYNFGEIPTVAWSFMHTWQSATGAEIPEEWLNAGINPDWVLRNIVAINDDGTCREFGFSRSWGTCRLSGWLYDHLGHFVHFFGQSHPENAAIAQYLQKRIRESEGKPEGECFAFDSYSAFYPVNPFLLTGLEKAPPGELPEGLPMARHFETVGLVLMSSGFRPDDTYALFAPGGGVTRSEHFDTSHFTIYRKGYLALDSGGMAFDPTGQRGWSEHSTNYQPRTVAHNCVLIRMPGEVFGGSKWGQPKANSGGQTQQGWSAKVLAFETGNEYSYVANDAARTYSPGECSQMVRQFIFLPPDHFVVFDRVTSTKAEYPKRWLLHTSNEPVVTEKEFYADQGQGRIFCRTLYPLDARLEKVGGPGREFWADGKNRPLPEDWPWWARYANRPSLAKQDIFDTLGRWRVEVSPGNPRQEDYFLHLIQVSDQNRKRMSETEVTDSPNQIDLRFTEGTRTYRLSLNKKGEVGGRLHISEGGKVLVDRALTREVMPQKGLALTE